MEQVITLLVLLGFGLPWTCVARWLLRPEESTLEGLIDRVCLGCAIAFFVLFGVSQFDIWIFVPVWIAGLACLVISMIHGKAVVAFQTGPEGKILLIGTAAYVAIRSVPLFIRDLPLGWDPYFHLILADNIVTAGRTVTDWLPYEDIPLNYPIGSHLLLALTSWVTRIGLPGIFGMAIVLFTALTGVQVFSLVSRSTQNREIALYSATAYLFCAKLGSLGYSLWGGLPNLVAMYLFLGLLSSLLVESGSLWRATAVFALYFLSLSFVHHHVMVTAGGVLFWLFVYFVWIGRDSSRAKRILVGMLASGIIGTSYFLPYLLKTVALGRTGILTYHEPIYTPNFILGSALGFSFAVPVCVGLCFYLRFRKKYSIAPVVPQSILAMIAPFIVVGYVGRAAAMIVLGRDLAPFTPSRFLTDAVAGLSLFAGVCFWEMRSILGVTRKQVVTVIVLGFAFNVGVYKQTFEREIPDARRAAYEWIKKNTDANAILMDCEARASYLSGRVSCEFPLPTSEYWALAGNGEMIRALRDH